MGRHTDRDGDGIADQGGDQRDEHALSDEHLDPAQDEPERWVGVTRDPDALPVGGLT